VGLQSGLEGIYIRLTDVERSSVGNEFLTVGAATRKLLVPSFVRVLGTNKKVAALSRTKTGPGSVVRHGNTDAREIRRPHVPNKVKSQQSDLELSSLGDRQPVKHIA